MAMSKLPGDNADEGADGVFADINITPLTDIFLVLLIIFMVTSSAMVESQSGSAGVKVNLPKGGATDVRATQTDGLAVRDLAAALQRLPLEQRQVLFMVGVEDMSYAEVAALLAVPVGTVMSRLSRGRERLRALLDGTATASPLRLVK